MNNIYRALIVDDEPLARNIIKSYLKPWENIEVVDECSNGFEALKSVKEHKPDLMFLDIQMPKVTGLELMEVIDDPVLVVFTTAYDQYALKAFELNAVDYLLKPFNEKRFGDAVNKLIQKLETGEKSNQQQINSIQEQSEEKLERIVVKKGNKLEVIPLEDILYIEAQDDYVMIYTSDAHFLKAKTMKYFEDHLPPENFIRIHRSYVVNVEKIKQLEPYNKDTQLAVISNECKLKVSRTGYKKLKEILDF
nr:LytTR family DNA-binding domain-containing protein [uncultured Carboxylicivirga sp.]